MTSAYGIMAFSFHSSHVCSYSQKSNDGIERIPIVIPFIPERRHNDDHIDEPGIDEPYIPEDPGEEPDEEDAFKDYVTG
jgi:hypothetical protein